MTSTILKKAIGDFIYRVSSSAKGDSEGPGFRVLNYHSITDELVENDRYQITTPKELFREQMRYLSSNGYCVISCGEAVDMMNEKGRISQKAVCITLDDGFKNTLTNAAPVLREYGLAATIFLATDFIGKGVGWLDWDGIDELSDMGFSFGSHSLTHRKLSALDANELDKELGMSKKMLEDRLECRVDLFAYPFGCYGSFDGKSIGVLRANGYRGAFTTIVGYNRLGGDPYRIKRMRVSWFDDNDEFAKELRGAYDWYATWQRIRGSV